MFGMFGGAQQDVELRFAARLAGVVLDRFGKEVTLLPDGGSFFRVHVQAVVSPQFMGWVAGFGTDAKLLGPPAVVREYTAFCREMLAQYEQALKVLIMGHIISYTKDTERNHDV